MITAKFVYSGDIITGFSVSGHSGSAEIGKDIICSAVSSASYMTVNTLTEIMLLNPEIIEKRLCKYFSSYSSDFYVLFIFVKSLNRMQLIRDTSPCRSLAIEVRVCYTEYPFGKSAFVEVIMLALYEPKYEGLWFRQMMLADEDTMSYHRAWGGTPAHWRWRRTASGWCGRRKRWTRSCTGS